MNEEQIRKLMGIGLRDGASPDEIEDFVRTLKDQVEAGRSMTFQPDTVDYENRTIDILLSSEQPVRMFDWDRYEYVDEILLMSGVRLDDLKNDKIGLLDNHHRGSTRDVYGSIERLRVESDSDLGEVLNSTASFSSTENKVFIKCAEGHLDHASVGYQVHTATYVEPGESTEIDGRTFTATANRTLKISTAWTPREGSLTVIGADSNAGARSAQDKPNKQKQTTKENIMPEELRKFLESKGMPVGASDDEARAFQATLEVTKPEPKIEPTPEPDKSVRSEEDIIKDAKRKAIEQIQKRNADLDEVFKPFLNREGVRELRDEAGKNIDTSVEEVRSGLLTHLAKSSDYVGRGQVIRDESDNFRSGAAAAVSLRCGNMQDKDLTEEERGLVGKYQHMDMGDLARKFLEGRNEDVRGLSKHDIIGRALSHATGDFPIALGNVANKSALAGYDSAETTYQHWTARRALSDFKTSTIAGLSEAGVMPQVIEGEPIPYHTMTEKKEQWILASYGQIFAITRQGLINDDLSMFTDLPNAYGRAWKRTINQLAVTKLLANAALVDTVALFHADHNNLVTGSASDPTTKAKAEVGIASMVAKLRAQTDIAGTSKINVPPRVLLAGPTAERFVKAALFETNLSDNNAESFIRGLGLTAVIEPELENANITGYSATAMHMFADAMSAPSILVGFLNGNDAPRIERATDFNTDAVKFKVCGDAAAGVADFRGVVKSTGA